MPVHSTRNVAETYDLLIDLLTTVRRYRRQWEREVKLSRSGLNQSAVASVVERHLWDSGERSDTETGTARRLKDRISRMMSRRALSPETLGWVMAAFDMDAGDVDRLRATYFGVPTWRGVADTLRQAKPMFGPQTHRTLNLIERYTVSRDHGLRKRRTLQTIRAIQDVDRYLFNHEREASVVEVLHGGDIGTEHEYGNGLAGTEITLDRPLARSETTSLEYRTSFEPQAVARTEVRRAALARVEHLDLAVGFGRVAPSRVWWCVWDDRLVGHPVTEELVAPRKGMYRVYLPYVERAVVGFRWEWQPH